MNALRARQQRNFLATLVLSQGVPMLLGGDELGRTQRGNNNAWCQDNELSWYRWDEADAELVEFAKRLIRLRRDHPVFHRTSFLTGREQRGSGLPDVWWFRADGRRMTQRDWQRGDAHTLGLFLNGREITTRGPHGHEIDDDSFLVLFNAHYEPVAFQLPARRFGRGWLLELDTARPERIETEIALARSTVEVSDRSLVLLRRA